MPRKSVAKIARKAATAVVKEDKFSTPLSTVWSPSPSAHSFAGSQSSNDRKKGTEFWDRQFKILNEHLEVLDEANKRRKEREYHVIEQERIDAARRGDPKAIKENIDLLKEMKEKDAETLRKWEEEKRLSLIGTQNKLPKRIRQFNDPSTKLLVDLNSRNSPDQNNEDVNEHKILNLSQAHEGKPEVLPSATTAHRNRMDSDLLTESEGDCHTTRFSERKRIFLHAIPDPYINLHQRRDDELVPIEDLRKFWVQKCDEFRKAGGLCDASLKECESFLRIIPIKARSCIADQFFEMKEAAGSKLSIKEIDLILDGFIHCGDVIGFKKYFDHGQNLALSSNGRAILSLYESAMLLLERVDDIGTAWDGTSTEVDSLAMRLYLDMIRLRFVEPNTNIMNSLMKVLMKRSRDKDVEDLFALMKMRSRKTQPNLLTYTLMMKNCLKSKNAERAFDLLEEIRCSNADQRLEPDIHVYAAIISVYAKRPDYHFEAWKLVSDVSKRGLQTNADFILSMFELCANSGDYARIPQLIDYANQAGNDLDELTLQKIWTNVFDTLRQVAKLYTEKHKSNADRERTLFATERSPSVEEDVSIAKEKPFQKVSFSSLRSMEAEADLVLNYLSERCDSILTSAIISSYISISIVTQHFSRINHLYNKFFGAISIVNNDSSAESKKSYPTMQLLEELMTAVQNQKGENGAVDLANRIFEDDVAICKKAKINLSNLSRSNINWLRLNSELNFHKKAMVRSYSEALALHGQLSEAYAILRYYGTTATSKRMLSTEVESEWITLNDPEFTKTIEWTWKDVEKVFDTAATEDKIDLAGDIKALLI